MKEYTTQERFLVDADYGLITSEFTLKLDASMAKDLSAIAKALARIDQPATIRANYLSIENEASKLAEALGTGSHPITLDFTGSHIEKQDILALADALKRTKRTVTLVLDRLDSCKYFLQIKPMDLLPLARALAVMTVPCKLSLQKNHFLYKFILELAIALRKAKQPHTIDISSCADDFTPQVVLLIEALQRSQKSHSIISDSNGLSENTQRELQNNGRNTVTTFAFFKYAQAHAQTKEGDPAQLPPLPPMVMAMLGRPAPSDPDTRLDSEEAEDCPSKWCLVM